MVSKRGSLKWRKLVHDIWQFYNHYTSQQPPPCPLFQLEWRTLNFGTQLLLVPN